MKKKSKSNTNSPSQVGRNTQTQESRNFNNKFSSVLSLSVRIERERCNKHGWWEILSGVKRGYK